jgi:cytidylate kinase
MVLAIAISGLHGTGKSTYARSLAGEFGLRHVSTGELFRQMAAERNLSLTELTSEADKDGAIDRFLDGQARKEIERGGVVIDGLLAGWIAREYVALKMYLVAPYDVRVNRIACRDRVSYAEAERVTLLRERVERRRFKRLYGIDIDDLSIYDMVLNTGLLPLRSNVEVIKSFVKEYVKTCGGK